MHWLADRIAAVSELSPARGADAEARRRFLQAMEGLVAEAGARPGVDTAFASFEGLLVAISGATHDEAEALAALAQSTLQPALDAAEGLSLGAIHQLVVVGETSKLALIRVGPVTFGLRSPSTVSLAASTST